MDTPSLTLPNTHTPPAYVSLRYTMRVGGLEGWYDMVIAALTSDRIQLSRDIADLEYLMEKMKKL